MGEQNNRLNSYEMKGSSPYGGSSQSGVKIFEIHVRGQLDNRWSEWLEGLEMRLLDNGEMVLIGPIIDQAALMGVLNKLSRLNLALFSVNEVKEKDGSEER